MNRLHHLQETLPTNLRDCAGNENVEFVILDYNSTDGLEDWMKTNFHSFNSKVLKKFSCLHYVHYDDYGSEWDEWVSPDNIKKQ